jgi:hypothetical protein
MVSVSIGAELLLLVGCWRKPKRSLVAGATGVVVVVGSGSVRVEGGARRETGEALPLVLPLPLLAAAPPPSSPRADTLKLGLEEGLDGEEEEEEAGASEAESVEGERARPLPPPPLR